MVRPDLLRQAAASLLADAVAVDVVAALDAAGLRSVLLRGPAMARELYDAAEVRPYRDVDLLLHPEDWSRSREVLGSLGLRPVADGARPDEIHTDHAETWFWAARGGVVDLHRTLAGLEAPWAWPLVGPDARELVLAGRAVRTPSPAGLALVVALHAAQHGTTHPPAVADLRRALERLDERTWREAAARAASAGGTAGFVLGLRQRPEGAALVERLGLEPGRPSAVQRLAATAAPRGALTFELLSRTPPRRVPGVVLGKLVPSRAVMRAREPLARRGRRGLLAAHLVRWTRAAGTAVPAWRAWRRERDAG